jgi:Lamin Tail Domain
MTRRRLIAYLLLNVLVSILVTGMILFLYDRFGRPECAGGIGAEAGVVISGVAGPGDVDIEIVTLRNTGEDAVVLTGWTLRDGDETAYTFPSLTLFPGGSVQVHSGRGEDTATDLFWRVSSPVWESDELAVLYDTQGLARAFYRLP